ncbi:MAG: metallophosphatase family protein [Cellvibrionaceae bacterium]|nr:metallophosphatase family protein [Cellvibrionaceae bacterium]
MSRYAVLSDIHSNIWALNAVLEDALNSGITQFINLGDILYGPLAPHATYQRLVDLEKRYAVTTISGNQDRDIVAATEATLAANPTLRFIHTELGDDALAWLSSLPFDAHLPNGLQLCHGTPQSDLIYLLETIQNMRTTLRSTSEIEALVGKLPPATRLLLCGHTHLPRQVELNTTLTIVNPGSVGLPAYADDEPTPHRMETRSNCAQYAIISFANQQWHCEQRAIAYDFEPAAQAALARNRADWAHALRTGYAPI